MKTIPSIRGVHRSVIFRARLELAVCIAVTVVLVTLAVRTEAFEALYAMTHRYEHLELDEFFSAFVVLTGVLGVFAFRRCLDLAGAMRHQRQAMEELRESERRFAAAFRSSPQAQLVVGLRDGTVLEANAAFFQLTELEPGAVLRRRLQSVEIWDTEGFVMSLPRLIRQKGSLQNLESTVRTASGQEREVLVSAAVIEMNGHRCILLGLNDISARKDAERQLSWQAFHDALTGLPNRVLFRDRVSHALTRAERAGPPLAVMFLDLDRFKWINDSFGHQVGDELLRQVGERLLECLRDSDTCARLGGDEFAVLIEDAGDYAALVRVAERMLQAVGARFHLTGLDTSTSVSIGIARSEPGMDVDALLRSADLAMYMAKAAGKGRFAVYEPAMHQAAVERTSLENDLNTALERGQFVLHYQPVTRLSPNVIVSFEALVRWQHPVRGLLGPGEFIPLAEENGLILELGRWVLRQACAQCAYWQQTYPREVPVTVSVNLSGRQIAQPGLVEEVAAALRAARLDPSSLVLEVTETVLMLNDHAAVDRLWELRALGVKLAIDDFGTGYSSLAYLQSFPVDVLKVDRSFTERLSEAGPGSPISTAVFALGRTLELQTVAEGIETEEQWARLRDLGCELGQGYFIARPVPPREAEAMLEAEPVVSSELLPLVRPPRRRAAAPMPETALVA
jgi:diguanylate cyclase (GGDEF)-like protein/PAS domain S-box-containing protein